MKAKIGLFLGSEPSVGGTFQYNQAILEAIAALPKADFDPVVVYTHEHWQDYLKPYGLASVCVPAQRGIAGRVLTKLLRSLRCPNLLYRLLCASLHPVAREIVRQRCDVWLYPSQDDWTFQIPVPAIGVIHDLMHRYETEFPEVRANGEYERRERRYSSMCRWSKGILVDSEVGKRQVIDSYGVSSERVHVLPFIAPSYLKQPSVSTDIAQRYSLPERFIFYPAQFWEHKNHKGLIHAIALLKEELPDLQLVCSGTQKNGYPSTLELVKTLGLEDRVHFIGYVPDADMGELYRHARAMVMPTFFGPTNIPPLEAIAIGCPVAVSHVYAMPEQLGDAALYFNPYQPTDIAAVVRQLWLDDELCTDLRNRGLRRSQQWTQADFNQRVKEILYGVLVDAKIARQTGYELKELSI